MSNNETDATTIRQQTSAALRKAALNEDAKTYLLVLFLTSAINWRWREAFRTFLVA